MKRLLVSLLGCLCAIGGLSAQKIAGKVVDANGNGISYVNIGVVDSGIGTIADRDGNFKLMLPDTLAAGTILTFTHISYIPLEIPAERVGEYGGSLSKLIFELVEKEYKIEEVTITANKKKPKKLAGRGTIFPLGSLGYYATNDDITEKQKKNSAEKIEKVLGKYADKEANTNPKRLTEINDDTKEKSGLGKEIGSVMEVNNRFIIKYFEFPINANSDNFTRLRINVYSIDEGKMRNVLNLPIYVDICKLEYSEIYSVEPEEQIVLEKGKYFVSLEIVETSEGKGILFPMYIKSSYVKNGIMGTFEKVPYNMGLVVYGYEIK